MALMLTGFTDPISEMERTMDRVLNRTFGNILGERPLTARGSALNSSIANVHLPLDIVENASSYELHADAPGMSPEDVKVELHEGVLTISGERKVVRENKDKEGKMWRSERSSYAFCRSFTLPENANPDGIGASMDKGVLTVSVPKRELPKVEKTPKRIAVSGGAAPEAPAAAEKK